METNVKNRGWVKNAAIIFLAVLLVLTFFSNSFMNRSLAEVATQSVQNGSITARVRGTGVVEATGSYEVKSDSTRKIQAVMIKAGQEVSQGDVLFVLGEGASEELEAATEELRQLQLSYQQTAVGIPSFDYSLQEAEIKRAEQTVTEAKAAMDAALADLKSRNSNLADYDKKLNAAEKTLNDALAALETAKAALAKENEDDWETVLESTARILVLKDKQAELEDALGIKEPESTPPAETETPAPGDDSNTTEPTPEVTPPANGNEDSEKGLSDETETYTPGDDSNTDPGPEDTSSAAGGEDSAAEPSDETETPAPSSEVEPAPAPEDTAPVDGEAEPGELSAYGIAASALLAPGRPQISVKHLRVDTSLMTADEKKRVEKAENWLDEQLLSQSTDEARLKKVRKLLDREQQKLDQAQARLNTTDPDPRIQQAQSAVDAAQAELDSLLKLLGPYADDYRIAKETYDTAVVQLDTLKYNLEQTKQSNNRSAASSALSLQDIRYRIEQAQKKLADLSGGEENTVVAPVGGIIDSIAYTAGNTAPKGEILCLIQVPDLGYTLSFSVTNDQARRLRPGDTASITNYYWGSQIDATLNSIRTDPKAPQTNKLLTFDVTGDVNPGSELTIAVGSKSQNYDLIVPNSAIRSDANGSFVLAIEAKNSPLGNRYYARRVEVSVLASDDVNSAVTGDLSYGDFVVTTSNRPVQAGDMVRMPD